MTPLLIFLLSLYQLQTITFSAVVDSPRYGVNAITGDNEDEINALIPPEVDGGESNSVINTNSDESSTDTEKDETIPFVKSGHDQTEVEFRHPISSVNIDYSKNVIVLKFRQKHPKLRSNFELDEDEEKRRKAFENNFMRFGRSSADFMRFGKRQIEEIPEVNSIDHGWLDKDPMTTVERFERSNEGIRDSRGDNFMRFGRAPADFMRFGRNPSDFMRLGRSHPSDFMRLGRSHPSDFMRLGRSQPSDFMRLGRGGPDDFMRFGRTPTNKDFMRFGRTQQVQQRKADKNFMRFGRPDNFMRFGRTPADSTDKVGNFMRFGKSQAIEPADQSNHTKTLLQKSDIKEAAKLLRQTDKDVTDESNPMDKAIKVLFSKQQHQKEEQQRQRSSEESDNSQSDDLDYGYNVLN